MTFIELERYNKDLNNVTLNSMFRDLSNKNDSNKRSSKDIVAYALLEMALNMKKLIVSHRKLEKIVKAYEKIDPNDFLKNSIES